MPQLDFDGANSRISADKIRGQSGTTVTIPAGHNLVGDGSGLTSLPAANLTGTVATARLGSGTADSTTFLRGDQTYATAGGLYESIAVISDTKAQATGGGTATSGAWRTRDLNTEDSDVDGIVSIASNQFTLQAGTYTVEFSAPAVDVNYHQANLENTTDSLTYKGSTERAWGTSDQSTTRSMGVAVFTIASAKVFEIQHRVYATIANGFGLAGVLDGVEVYTIVKILKHA